ncbi:MAG: cell division protein ZapA [Bryobacterales bacterium]|nr:cell division protein ZapA [Bryobacterales bacterium]
MDSSNAPKKPVRVTIYNQSYTLRAAGEPAGIEELAREIDGLMEDIASKSGDVDPARVAVLACLHLADRLRALEQELAQLRERVDRKSREFTLLLETALGED